MLNISESILHCQKPSKLLHEDPFIGYYEKLFSPDECRHLIHLGAKNLQPAGSYGHGAERQSDFFWLQHYADPIVSQISIRMADTVGLPLNRCEPLQIARYDVGGIFHAHIDCFNIHTEHGKAHVDASGQRMMTAILYLNTVASGGATTFPQLNIEVAAEEGNLLVFEDCKRGTGEPHPLSLHEGSYVNEGQKWIATLWFRERTTY